MDQNKRISSAYTHKIELRKIEKRCQLQERKCFDAKNLEVNVTGLVFARDLSIYVENIFFTVWTQNKSVKKSPLQQLSV